MRWRSWPAVDLLPAIRPDDLVVAVSASAGSAETLDAVERLGVDVVAVANQPGPLTERATRTVWMEAGEERGGVACRSYQHTLALLLELVRHLTGGRDVPLTDAAAAAEDLLLTEPTWRPRVAELLLGPDGTHVVAPARRISSAYQSALMLREGPRLRAYGCETGDWSHVDVYLTKTTDYRMLLLGGSRWEEPLLEWTSQRGSTVVGVGTEVPGAASLGEVRARRRRRCTPASRDDRRRAGGRESLGLTRQQRADRPRRRTADAPGCRPDEWRPRSSPGRRTRSLYSAITGVWKSRACWIWSSTSLIH